MRRFYRTLCWLFGHSYRDTVKALDCGSGCTDIHRVCHTCGGEVQHEVFRRWSCLEHGRVAMRRTPDAA